MATNNAHTIYLTPQEDERIRKSLKARWQKCQELSGQPREPRDHKTAMSQATFANLMSDMEEMSFGAGQKTKSDTMVTFAVGHPYPPCTTLVEDLQPMKISELRMETHHRGCILKVHRVAPVVRLAGHSWTMVQEEGSDEIERLEISLHSSNCGEDILDFGKIYKIKEPYFTFSDDQSEATLRIDHPSDIIVLPEELHPDSKHTENSEDSTAAAIKSATESKDQGNAALKQRELLLAHSKYSQGLREVASLREDLKFDLFRNRAHVNLLLNRLDEAKDDGLHALTNIDDQRHQELDSKAYFRAGSAAYRLGDFQEAKRLFEGQQKLMPDKEASARVRKSELRLQEQATGAYNFKELKTNLLMTRSQVEVEAGSFTKNTEIKDSPKQGRGLFATCDIKSGDAVICEKPFCVVWGHEKEALTALTYDDRDDRIRVVPAGLYKAAVQKLRNNPSEVEKVLDLYGDYAGIGKQKVMGESGPVIDTFQIQDIIARNAFGLGASNGEGDANNASTGIWVWASYINHSCISNAKKEFIGDLMILRATRAIKAGEEITHTYDASHDYDERAAALMNTWGFACACKLCAAEKADGPALRKKRKELETDVDRFVSSEKAIGAKRLVVLKAKRISKSIEDTYDAQRYKDLPRTAMDGIQQWLAAASAK